MWRKFALFCLLIVAFGLQGCLVSPGYGTYGYRGYYGGSYYRPAYSYAPAGGYYNPRVTYYPTTQGWRYGGGWGGYRGGVPCNHGGRW